MYVWGEGGGELRDDFNVPAAVIFTTALTGGKCVSVLNTGAGEGEGEMNQPASNADRAQVCQTRWKLVRLYNWIIEQATVVHMSNNDRASSVDQTQARGMRSKYMETSVSADISRVID